MLCLHLIGAYTFSRSLEVLGVERRWMVGLYTLVPFGNIVCMVELSKAVNARMKAIGVTRKMNDADIRVIERQAL
jgi:hypothetical protein